MIDPAIARSIEGVVFDLDDTLTRDGVVEREAYDALWALRERGLRAIAVTGRPLGWAEVLATTWPVDLAIGENGAGWWWREGRTLRSSFFAAGDAAALERVRARVASELPDVREAIDQPLRRRDLAFDIGETVRLEPSIVERLVAIIEREGMRTMVSTVHAHAIPGDWDKARGAVRALHGVLGLDEERVRTRLLFVGDSGNDAAAFGFFEHTAGVANVRDHLHVLPRAPRWIARADRGRGFAEIVSALIAGRA